MSGGGKIFNWGAKMSSTINKLLNMPSPRSFRQRAKGTARQRLQQFAASGSLTIPKSVDAQIVGYYNSIETTSGLNQSVYGLHKKMQKEMKTSPFCRPQGTAFRKWSRCLCA